jgi:hypothetical protein
VLLPTIANARLCTRLLCTRICLPHHATTAAAVHRAAIRRPCNRAALRTIAAGSGARHPKAFGLVDGRRWAVMARLGSVRQLGRLARLYCNMSIYRDDSPYASLRQTRRQRPPVCCRSHPLRMMHSLLIEVLRDDDV